MGETSADEWVDLLEFLRADQSGDEMVVSLVGLLVVVKADLLVVSMAVMSVASSVVSMAAPLVDALVAEKVVLKGP